MTSTIIIGCLLGAMALLTGGAYCLLVICSPVKSVLEEDK